MASSVPMAAMVGADKFAEIYDDPFFSTFADSGNQRGLYPLTPRECLKSTVLWELKRHILEALG